MNKIQQIWTKLSAKSGRMFPFILFFATLLVGIASYSLLNNSSTLNYSDRELATKSSKDLVANADPNSAAVLGNDIIAQANESTEIEKCQKLGVNWAIPGPVNQGAQLNEAATKFSMGYSLEIAYNAEGVKGLAGSFNTTLQNGLTPILRLCDASNCGFNGSDGGNYAEAVNQLAGDVNGPFYIIAGPNEPLTEPWTGGSEGDAGSVGPGVARFMNDTINGITASNVRILSPAFNATNGNFSALVSAMNAAGANWGGLDGIAANAYNLNGYPIGERISDYVGVINNQSPLNGKPIFFTEVGMYESDRNPRPYDNKVPHSQALSNLGEEIPKLRENGQVAAFLLFNVFGTNPDGNFDYNEMSDSELANAIGPECADQITDVTPIAGDDGKDNETPKLPSPDSCQPKVGYCEESFIDGSFEDSGLYQHSPIALIPDGTNAWWQDNNGSGAFQCGDWSQTPLDGNADTVCAPPEMIVSKPAGGQCSENLTSQGSKYFKMFTSFGSMNGGLCFDVPESFPGGTAGFDVKVKQNRNEPYGDVNLYIGYSTTLSAEEVTESTWSSLAWGNPTVVTSNEYSEPGNFRTEVVSRAIPGNAKSLCIRANNQFAGVGVNTFWDGGYLAPGNDICSTANQTADQDGVNRSGGGECSCDEDGNPVEAGGKYNEEDKEAIDYDFAKAQSKGWNISACHMEAESNGAPSPHGQLFVGLDLNKCSEQKNPEFTCEDENNWTAGYAWTSCLKELPLLNYLAAKEGTEANDFITDCELDAYRVFNPDEETDENFFMRISNEFPGATLLQFGEGNQVFMKTPRIGGAAACAFINWDDFHTDLHISPQLVDDIHTTGGFEVQEQDDSFIAKLLNYLKGIFSRSTIQDGADSNEIVLDTPVCSDLPGGPITKINTSDTAVFDFADDEGKCESIIEAGNYELTPNEVCDYNFIYEQIPNGKTGEIVGADCKLDNFDKVFEYENESPQTRQNLGDIGWIPRVETPLPNGSTQTTCLTETDPTVGTFCGQQFTCEDYIDEVYKACRDAGGNVTEITDSPFVRWERPEPVKNFYFKGLDRYIESAWLAEFTNVPREIIHENVGVKAKTCVSVYDLQLPDTGSSRDRRILGASSGSPVGQQTTENDTVSTSAVDLENDELYQQVEALKEKFGESYYTADKLVNYVDFDPVRYAPVYSGGYDLAYVKSRESAVADGASQVCFDVYLPWVGQIPRIYERLSYFLSNQSEEDTGKPFLDFFSSNNNDPNSLNQSPAPGTEGEADVAAASSSSYEQLESQINPELKYLLIPKDGSITCDRPNCDYFAPEGEVDPLKEYLASKSGSLVNDLFPDLGDDDRDDIDQCTPDGSPGSVNKNGLVSPLKSIRVTQCFGPTINDGSELARQCRNLFPAVGFSNYDYGDVMGYFHTGIDAGGRQLVYSAGDGIVEKSEFNGGYGNRVLIRHTSEEGQTFWTQYHHLEYRSVEVGDVVTKDTELGMMGTTGNSTGVHLHFEVMSCTRYAKECFDDPTQVLLAPRDGSGDSEPPEPTTPAEGEVSGTPAVDDDDDGDTTNDQCDYTPPTEGSRKNIMCLAIDTANFINSQYGGRIAPEFLWSVFYQETLGRCSPSHRAFHASYPQNGSLGYAQGYGNIATYTDSCTGNPNQVAMAEDGNIGYPQIRGVTQFSTNAFSKVATSGYISGFNPESGSILDACINYLSVDTSKGQEGQVATSDFATLIPDSLQSRVSRARVGDSICATALMTSDLGAYYGNSGQYAAPEEWFNGTRANRRIIDKAAGLYHGACVYTYPNGNTVRYCDDVEALMLWAREEFKNIDCNDGESSDVVDENDDGNNPVPL